MYVCMCMYVCMYVCMYACMYVCMCVSVCMYPCTYVCIYVRMYECVCVCMHTHIHAYTHTFYDIDVEDTRTRTPGSDLLLTLVTNKQYTQHNTSSWSLARVLKALKTVAQQPLPPFPHSARASSFTRFLDAPQSVGLLWTRNELAADTPTWHHTTLTTDKYPCLRWDSNPQSQQASGRIPTP